MACSQAAMQSTMQSAEPSQPLAERECGGGFMATSLQKAAHSGDIKSLELALECTATNLDAVDAEGRTALMIAAAGNRIALVRALCDAGADISATNCDGLAAADLATQAGHTECAERLREAASMRAQLLATMTGSSESAAPKMEDIMAKMLAEAGMPKGCNEAPF